MHPILFELGRWRIFTYGVLIALGGVLSSLFWMRRRSAMGLAKDDDVWLLINGVLLGGFLGGRVLFLFEYVAPFSREFWLTAFSFNRGFSVMGAFVGVIGGVWLCCRRLNVPFLRVLDYVCLAAPFWHFFGRLGCYAAGCCFGRPAGGGLPWAVAFTDPRSLVPPELLGVPLHPAQLYEGFADLLLSALLYLLVLSRVERGSLPRGSVCVAYLASYAVLRFLTEYYRGDVVGLPILGLTAAQGASILLFLFAAGIAWAIRRGA